MKYLNISDKIKLDNITYNYDIKKEKPKMVKSKVNQVTMGLGLNMVMR